MAPFFGLMILFLTEAENCERNSLKTKEVKLEPDVQEARGILSDVNYKVEEKVGWDEQKD